MSNIENLKDYPGGFITTTQAEYLNMTAKAVRSQIGKGALPTRKAGDEYLTTDQLRPRALPSYLTYAGTFTHHHDNLRTGQNLS